MTARRADNPPQTPRRGRGRPRKDATLAVGDPGVFAGSMAEDLARAVLQSLPAHLAVIEADGRVVAVNKAWEKFSQDLAETFEHPIALGENYLDALVDGRTFERSRREAALAGVNEILDRQRARFELEYPLVTKAETRWFLLSVTPLLGAEGGAVIAHLEMTDLKRAELAANEKTQVLQAVLDSTADGVVVADHTGEFLIFNRAAREIAGVGAIEAPTEQWSKMFGLFHEDRTTAFREEDLPLHLAVQGKSTDRVPMWVRNKEVPDGRMISVSGRPWSTPGGESNGGVVVFRDISQDAVSENRLRFQSGVLDAVPNAVLALDRDGTVVYWNRASEQLVGWSAGELIGKRGRDILLPAEDRARVDGIRAYVEAGGIFRGEFPAQRPDGTPVPILALASALRSVHGDLDGFVVVGVDLTDLRTTQEALRVREHEMRQFQKMEAIGRLAGGIAHDFNNLLTVIRGYMDILITRLEPGHPALEDARQVADAAERATALTAQLLAFGRRRPIQTALLQLNDVVKDFLPMLERTIGENIKVVADLAPDLSPVKADAGQLGQVLLNLALNARDAMPEGGTLTITSDHAELDVGYPGLHVPLTPGSYVRLSVTDTGIGMDEETRVRVFEPFFTTKGPGHGTGLGLATAYGIIRQLDGAIWVYSEPGHGTTFRIYLPRVFESFTAPIEAPPAPTPARGGEIVLLVEDEDAVRAVERKLLEAQGYRVLEAPSGAAALELLGEYDGRIDLLLSDVIMPGMNGREVADAVRKVRPGLRVLYVSGHSGEVMNRHGGLETGANFLNKPFSGAELTAAVRAAIDGPPGPSS